MNLFENCNNNIDVESHEEQYSENQISISFIITEISPFKKKIKYDFTSKLQTLFFVRILLGTFW